MMGNLHKSFLHGRDGDSQEIVFAMFMTVAATTVVVLLESLMTEVKSVSDGLRD
jgi:hypothetical protein